MDGGWLTAGALLAASLACFGVAFGRWGRAQSALLSPQPGTPAPRADLASMAGSEPGWLRVSGADDLLALLKAETSLGHLRRQSRLAPAVFERDFLLAIHRYAEFVQLMPASESHHHAHAGGLLSHTLEMVLAALTWRNGCLLPQGAQAEQVDAQRDHWTYVVFFAALLHDAGKPMADLRVACRKPRSSVDLPWMPLAGSLVEFGAAEYKVGFTPKAQRDYGAHQRVAVTLLQRFAPPTALSFIASVPEAMHALTRVLNGEDRDGAIASLVQRADRASVGHALLQGSRARFATATSVPLVELLMQALRDLLQRGGAMPLNRDGAIGWVSDGSVWFVAKRLADTVRAHLAEHAPDEAVPGGAKNDRLFDVWQEYGCLTVNPVTAQAIWYVVVHGEDGDGYQHRLTMLRFPLEKLWDDPSKYPGPMRGRIEVLAGKEPVAQALPFAEAIEAPVPPPAAAASVASAAPVDSASKRAPVGPTAVPAPRFERVRTAGTASQKVRVPPPQAARDDQLQPKASTAASDGLLDDEDSAGSEAKRLKAQRLVPQAAPPAAPPASAGQGAARADVDQALGPVVLPASLPRLSEASEPNGKPVPELATAFMRWLQAGLASQELKYNESGAPVHFVREGMALVSPLIFREFARQAGLPSTAAPDRLGLDVQRDVLRAGWHVPGAGGVNVHQYAVLKRGAVKAGKLSAVVLADPQRWVYPVPAANPALAPWVAEAAPASSPA